MDGFELRMYRIELRMYRIELFLVLGNVASDEAFKSGVECIDVPIDS